MAKGLTYTLEATMRRQEGKKWLAKITGVDSSNRSGFAFEFLTPTSQEWGKVGTRKAVFEISEPGFYYDSDGDYGRVTVSESGGLEWEAVSAQDIRAAIIGVGEEK